MTLNHNYGYFSGVGRGIAGNGPGACEVGFFKSKILKMKNIQMLIDMLKYQKEKAERFHKENNDETIKAYHYGRIIAFSFCIKELEAELLLKNDTGATPGKPPFPQAPC